MNIDTRREVYEALESERDRAYRAVRKAVKTLDNLPYFASDSDREIAAAMMGIKIEQYEIANTIVEEYFNAYILNAE